MSDSTPTPLAQSAMVVLNQEEFAALMSAAMSADPLPNKDQEPLNRFLDRVAVQFGAQDWIDAYHRVPVAYRHPTEPLTTGEG
jgi:hypothetical protein